MIRNLNDPPMSTLSIPKALPHPDALGPHGFNWALSDGIRQVLVCQRCGALVLPELHLRHIAFHQQTGAS